MKTEETQNAILLSNQDLKEKKKKKKEIYAHAHTLIYIFD